LEPSSCTGEDRVFPRLEQIWSKNKVRSCSQSSGGMVPGSPCTRILKPLLRIRPCESEPMMEQDYLALLIALFPRPNVR